LNFPPPFFIPLFLLFTPFHPFTLLLFYPCYLIYHNISLITYHLSLITCHFSLITHHLSLILLLFSYTSYNTPPYLYLSSFSSFFPLTTHSLNPKILLLLSLSPLPLSSLISLIPHPYILHHLSLIQFNFTNTYPLTNLHSNTLTLLIYYLYPPY
jgi:hypothetical protein